MGLALYTHAMRLLIGSTLIFRQSQLWGEHGEPPTSEVPRQKNRSSSALAHVRRRHGCHERHVMGYLPCAVR